MLWEILPLLVGFLCSYLIYHYHKFRVGGVIAIPILAIYTIKFPLIFIAILITSIFLFFFLEFLLERKAIYGRRLLYLSLSGSLIIMTSLQYFINLTYDWYALLLPGLMAYNYHRENHDGIEKIKSIMASLILYIVCIIASIIAFWVI